MKRVVKLLVFLAVLLCATVVSAQEAVLTVDFGIFDYGTIVIPSTMKLELHTSDGGRVAAAETNIDALSRSLTVDFGIPDYEEGAIYYLVPTEGAAAFNYVGTGYGIGDKIPLNTADGKRFSIEAIPICKPQTGVRTDSVTVRLHMKNGIAFPSSARLCLCNSNGELLAAKTAEFKVGDSVAELSFSVPQYYTGEQFYLIPTVGVVDATYYSDTYKPYAPIKIGTYAGLGENGEAIIGNSFDIGITVDTSGPENEYANWVENYVNSTGIGSRTNYFIWISKKDYKVNVLLRNNGAWDYLTSFDCAIGKASTPTITGCFEYFQYQEKWTYEKYYVAPIMRFAPNGYAMHSTLVKYNGAPYDGRVRASISHGCVRLAPQDIRWLADHIPLHTRVYVTN